MRRAQPSPGSALVIVLLAAVCLAGGVAPSAGAEVVTLERAVELAVANNLMLAAAREERDAAKWGLRSATSSLFPSVSFSSRATRVDPDTYRRANSSLDFLDEMGFEVEPFLYETTYETGFNVNVPIWNGGRLWAGVGAAGAGRDAAEHVYGATRRQVEVDAKNAYFGVLRAEALLNVARDAAGAAERSLAATRRKFEVGLVPKVELLRWEVVLAEDERDLAQAEAGTLVARSHLAGVLGLPLDADLGLVNLTRVELEAGHRDLAWVLGIDSIPEARARELLAANPEYLSLADAARASRAGVTIARGAFLPSLNAVGSYGWKADDDIDPDDETAWSVTLALDLPIFTSFKNLSDYQQSKRTHIAAQRRQEDLERGMITGLRSVVASLRSSMKALDAAEKQVAQTEEFQKNVTNRYDQGLAPYTELVDARVLYDGSRAGYVNALYDAYVAFAEVERLVGRAPARESGEER